MVSAVVELDHFEFNRIDTLSKDVLVVLFYHPFVPDPANIIFEYEMAALEMRGEKVLFAKLKINKKINRYHLIYHEINVVPQIKIFKYGVDFGEEYKGPKYASLIVKYVKSMQTFNDDLVALARNYSTPTVFLWNVHPYSFLYHKYLDDTENDKVMLYIDPKDESADRGASEFKSIYHRVAEKYRGKGLLFMLGDIDESYYLSDYFGLATSKEPLIVIKSCKGKTYGKKYLLHECLEDWLDDYKAGKVAEFSISAPIPPEDKNELVKVVVTDTFWDTVMAANKNVLLGLYRPDFKDWSNVTETLREVAQHYKDEKDDYVLIAMLDVSANDIRGNYSDDLTTLDDSTTLYLIPSSGPIWPFEEGITVANVRKFIKEHRQDPIKRHKTSKDQDMDCD